MPYHTTLGPAVGPTCSKILAPPLYDAAEASCTGVGDEDDDMLYLTFYQLQLTDYIIV